MVWILCDDMWHYYERVRAICDVTLGLGPGPEYGYEYKYETVGMGMSMSIWVNQPMSMDKGTSTDKFKGIVRVQVQVFCQFKCSNMFLPLVYNVQWHSQLFETKGGTKCKITNG